MTQRGFARIVGGVVLLATLAAPLAQASAATSHLPSTQQQVQPAFNPQPDPPGRNMRPAFNPQPDPPGRSAKPAFNPQPDPPGRGIQHPFHLRAAALPAGLAAVLARALSHGTDAPSVTWSQQAKLTASDGATDDYFGWSVVVSGTTALVGAYNKNNGAGAVYVFMHSGTTWSQQAELTASDGAPNDNFGVSLALNRGTLLIGACGKNNNTGAVYVFMHSGTTWSQQAELTAGDGAAGDLFGIFVALRGRTALIGASGKNNITGAAYVFVRSGTTWSQQAKLTASDGAPNNYFGLEVALSRGTALIGASGRNAGVGAVYVFVRNGTTWTQQAELTASDGTPNDYFGISVALSRDTALIGASDKTVGSTQHTGAAYVFVRSGTTWSQQQELTAGDGAASDAFGYAVALHGDTALIGAPYKNNNTGAAYVFMYSGTTWSQQAELTPSDATAGEDFGISTVLSGSTGLVGAYAYDNSGTGAAYVFVRT